MTLPLVPLNDYALGPLRTVMDIPYRDGAALLRQAVGIPTLNESILRQLTDNDSVAVPQRSFMQRTVVLMAGVLLCLPLLNIFVEFVLRRYFNPAKPYGDSERAVIEINALLPTAPHYDAKKPFFVRAEVASCLNRALRAAAEQMSSQVPVNPDFDETVAEIHFPDMEGVHSYNIGGINVGVVERQGRQSTWEDRHIATEISFEASDSHYARQKVAKVFGIFDGHGGPAAASFVSSHLPHYLSRNLTKLFKVGVNDGAVQQALRTTFLELDRDFGGTSGTTACVAVLIDTTLYVANVGDSRAIINQRTPGYLQKIWGRWPRFATFFGGGFLFHRIIQLSKDQRADDPEMVKGVIRKGGFITQAPEEPAKVNGVINIPRAIGDWDITGIDGIKCVSPLPKVTKIENPSGVLLMGSKGLWQAATTRQIGDLLEDFDHNHSRCHIIVSKLAAAAQQSGSDDNITIIAAAL